MGLFSRARCSALVILILPLTPAYAGAIFNIIDLPGQTGSLATNVSADGTTVVGFSIFPGTSSGSDRAFKWTSAGGAQMIGDTAGTTFMNRAWAITPDKNTIVGQQFGTPSSVGTAAVWTPATNLQFLNSTNPNFLAAFGVSNDGAVLAGEGALPQVPVRWTGGAAQNLGVLPGNTFGIAREINADGTVVVGRSANPARAFRWTLSGGMQDLGNLAPGAADATDVSDDGSVVVGVTNSQSGDQAFRWTSGGGMVGLGDLPGGSFSSTARGVSGNGQFVVGSSAGPFTNQAFIWDSVNGMRLLSQVLTVDYSLDLSGYNMISAEAISPDGTTVIGTLTDMTNKSHAFVVTMDHYPAIPEPVSIAAPLMALWTLARRRRRCGR